MKKVFSNDVLSVHPIADGIIISHRIDEENGKITVGFRKIVFSSGEVSAIQKNYFLMAKFGPHYKDIESKVGNYITCHVCELPDGGMLTVDSDGTARLMNENSEIVRESKILYHSEAPSGVAVSGRSFWCSFSADNSIVRFNINTMREELKLGGSRSPFLSPKGIWVSGNDMLVCNSGTKQILKIGLSSYAVAEYAAFEEPVNAFMQSGAYEFVNLDSGLYLLELVDL